MATARCYTKSGSVEKYESNLWSSPTMGNWSSMGIVGTITTPDSNGNYTVTPEQSFEDSSDTTTYSCFTEYGGVKKTFYFKKKNSSTSTSTYNINCKIWVTGNGHEISICADIESHDIQMPIPEYHVNDIYDLLRKDVIDTHIKVYINRYVNSHVIDFELSSYTWNGYVTPHFKYTVKFPNYNDNIVEEYGIGGIHDDIDDGINTKKKTITSKYNNCIYNVNYYIK